MKIEIVIDDYNNQITINNVKTTDNIKNIEKLINHIDLTTISILSIRSISGLSITNYRFILPILEKYTNIIHIVLDSFRSFRNCDIPSFKNVKVVHVALMSDTDFYILFGLPNLLEICFEIPCQKILSCDKFYNDLLSTKILYLCFGKKLDDYTHIRITEKFGKNVDNYYMRWSSINRNTYLV
jgi:hypothetical protein